MAIKDIISRGIGPSVSISFFITGGYGALAGATLSGELSGELAGGALENQIFKGQQSTTITLIDDTWVTGQSFNDARQAIIDGFDSSSNEIGGWNNEVRDKLAVPYVVRISDNKVNITLPAFSGYAIDANETITCTIPGTATAAANDLIAKPSFVITADDGTNNIVNTDSTIDVPNNYEQCDRSGFRQYPGDLIKNWDNVYTRGKSYDERHPQLMIRSVSENLKGSPSPEANEDTFVGVNEVTIDDL